jgi:hypothetical protein
MDPDRGEASVAAALSPAFDVGDALSSSLRHRIGHGRDGSGLAVAD